MGLAHNQESGQLWWLPGCPSNPTPDEPCCDGVSPFGRLKALTHGCRWFIQGSARNEFAGVQYSGPLSCISTGLPGASEDDIKMVIPAAPGLPCAQVRKYVVSPHVAVVHGPDTWLALTCWPGKRSMRQP